MMASLHKRESSRVKGREDECLTLLEVMRDANGGDLAQVRVDANTLAGASYQSRSRASFLRISSTYGAAAHTIAN
jgi:hypothetical protein